MKVKELKTSAVKEMNDAHINAVKDKLMEKMKNIDSIERTLAKLKKDLAEFEAMDVYDVEVEDIEY